MRQASIVGGVVKSQSRSHLRKGSLFAAGVLLGAALISPAAGHVSTGARHLWSVHIKPKADARYVGSGEILWARVSASGDLLDGRGAKSAIATGLPGQYRVTFDRKTDDCAWVATRNDALEGAGLIATKGGTDEEAVVVDIHTPSGLEGDPAPFSLTVTC